MSQFNAGKLALSAVIKILPSPLPLGQRLMGPVRGRAAPNQPSGLCYMTPHC